MKSNICSVFGKISGITEGMSKLRGVSVISEGGQVDKNEVEQLMIKNPDGLTEEEKEALAYAKIVLGEKEYAKLKNEAVFDNIATSPWTSGAIGSIDKSIGTGIDSTLGKEISFNDLNEKLKKLGYNHSYRRNLLRDIPKEARDIEVAPELPKGLKLAKGFGIASTALAGVTVGEDIKNNDTNAKRLGAVAIDAVGTVGGYAATGVLTEGALAGVAVAAVACGVASYAASTVKDWVGLK
jgi:hypothetical protein